jgi:hypothetical protein
MGVGGRRPFGVIARLGLGLLDCPVEPGDDSEVRVNLSEKRSRLMSLRSIL